MTSDRRITLQNELAYVLEHMSKNITLATGKWGDSGITKYTASGFRVRIDTVGTSSNYGDDVWVGYRTIAANPSQLLYCNRDTTLTGCNSPNGEEVIARKITTNPNGFTFSLLVDSTTNTNIGVEVKLIGRFSPSLDESSENPQVTLKSRIYSHSISTN